MSRICMRFALAAALWLLPPAAPAQDAAKSAGTYRLNLAFHQTDESRKVSTKTYTMLVQPGSWGRLRIGNKVPVQAGTQFTYVDVFTSLNCRLVEKDGELTLHTEIDTSSADADTKPAGQPLIRQVRSEGDASIVTGRAVSIAALDDPATGRRYEIEVAATKVR